jgi:hypothetical protein
MTKKLIKKQINHNNTAGLVVAELAGAAAVAGITVAATMALKDKKTRDKVRKVFNIVKNQINDYVNTGESQ